MFEDYGFDNYRGRVRIDDVIFNTVVRVGRARFGNVFYDINLEVDTYYLPHTKSASDIKVSTSDNKIISQSETKSNPNPKKSYEQIVKKWFSDLSKSQLDILSKTIYNDIKTSINAVTDTFCRKAGKYIGRAGEIKIYQRREQKMELTKGQRYLRLIRSWAKSLPKSRQEKFFKEMMETVIAKADYHKLSEEDIEFLRNAKFEKQ